MTLVVAANIDGVAYVLADSAITLRRPAPHYWGTTTVASDAVLGCPDYVYEGAMKVVDYGSALMSFAGDTDIFRSVGLVARRALAAGVPSAHAFRDAINSGTPVPPRDPYTFVFAWEGPHGPEVHLYGAPSCQWQQLDPGQVTAFGSGASSYFDFAADAVRSVRNVPPCTPASTRLALLSAAFHAIQGPTFRKTMLHGFGGAFIGGYLANGATGWAPDTYSVFWGHDGKFHTTFSAARDRVFFAYSTAMSCSGE